MNRRPLQLKHKLNLGQNRIYQKIVSHRDNLLPRSASESATNATVLQTVNDRPTAGAAEDTAAMV